MYRSLKGMRVVVRTQDRLYIGVVAQETPTALHLFDVETYIPIRKIGSFEIDKAEIWKLGVLGRKKNLRRGRDD